MNVEPKDWPTEASLYERDFHAWLLAQAEALRGRNAGAIDWAHVAEEMEGLARKDVQELRNRLARLIAHLLKMEHGRNRDPVFVWQATIDEQRDQIGYLLDESPSLRPHLAETAAEAWRSARREALRSFAEHEKALLDRYEAALPTDLPYTVEQLLDLGFLPSP